MDSRTSYEYTSTVNDDFYISISPQTLKRIEFYKKGIREGKIKPGKRLQAELKHFFSLGLSKYNPTADLTPKELNALDDFTAADFLQILINTREITMCAESEGLNSIKKGEWNEIEYNLLAHVTTVTKNVKVYDSGKWVKAGKFYKDDYHANLVVVSGAILKPDSPDFNHLVDTIKVKSKSPLQPKNAENDDNKEQRNADLEEKVAYKINEKNFISTYKERLLAAFEEINSISSAQGKKAFVTLPGIGNGFFGGVFKGKTIPYLHKALVELLQENGARWKNIDTIFLDGYDYQKSIKDSVQNNILVRVRSTKLGMDKLNGSHKLYKGTYTGLAQLSKPEEFAESELEAKRFNSLLPFKIGAGDPLSCNGLDWVGGSRLTDESAFAACNGLFKQWEAEGKYKHGLNKGYMAPKNFSTWENFIKKNNFKQFIARRTFTITKGVKEALPSEWLFMALKILGSNLIDRDYPYGKEGQAGRKHFRTISMSEELKKKYEVNSGVNLQGDHLKRFILDQFGKQLKYSPNLAHAKDLFTRFKNSKEYKVLNTPQGFFTNFFRWFNFLIKNPITTTSIKTLNKMEKEVENLFKNDKTAPLSNPNIEIEEDLDSSTEANELNPSSEDTKNKDSKAAAKLPEQTQQTNPKVANKVPNAQNKESKSHENQSQQKNTGPNKENEEIKKSKPTAEEVQSFLQKKFGKNPTKNKTQKTKSSHNPRLFNKKSINSKNEKKDKPINKPK